jgi:formate dehydrogenase (coenzyme F420) beta subunit
MSSIYSDRSVSVGIVELLRFLLESGKVEAVMAMRRSSVEGTWDLALLADPNELESVDPLAPVMTANAGQVLSALSVSGRRIAAVLRPCELRGLVERVKREQGSLSNLLTISHNCSGVFPIERITGGKLDELLSKYEKVVSGGGIPPDVRDTCRACTRFVPDNPDVMVVAASEIEPGMKGSYFFLKGSEPANLLEGFGEVSDGVQFDPSVMEDRLADRERERKSLFDSIGNDCSGLDGLLEVFGRCVGCHGCSRVCPICYCALCDFESMNFDYNLPYFEEHLSRRGALRLPPDTVLFHLGRLTHMSFSCVGCGMCSDVCPVGIPVAAVFSRTGERTAALFDYVPGRDVEEDIPVMVFKEEEFGDIG